MAEAGTKMEPLGTVLAVRLRLMQLGWRSLSAWGEAHGYPRDSVRSAVRNWGQRTDKTPHGGIARAVMRDLRTTLAEGRSPGQNVPDHLVGMAQFSDWINAKVEAFNTTPHDALPLITDPEIGERRHQTPSDAVAQATSVPSREGRGLLEASTVLGGAEGLDSVASHRSE